MNKVIESLICGHACVIKINIIKYYYKQYSVPNGELNIGEISFFNKVKVKVLLGYIPN